MAIKIDNITGVVLAGGQSTRMGTDKSQLSYQGCTLLDHAQQVLSNTCVNDTVLSGKEGEGWVKDLVPNLGPLGGIFSIFHNDQTFRASGFLFVTVDMPKVSTEMLDQITIHGSKVERPVCFEDCFLPLFLPNNLDVKAQLAKAITNEKLSVRGLLAELNPVFLAADDKSKLINLNRMQDWNHFLSDQKSIQECESSQ